MGWKRAEEDRWGEQETWGQERFLEYLQGSHVDLREDLSWGLLWAELGFRDSIMLDRFGITTRKERDNCTKLQEVPCHWDSG